jgi:flagellar biosynthesis activator protein FlaF
MSSHASVARAYAAAQGLRSVREQEADLFLRTNAALRASRGAGSLPLVRALADTSRLWGAVIDLVRDPENALPIPLRASIVSVGLAVQREVERPTPDIDFLLAVNADLAEGLGTRR